MDRDNGRKARLRERLAKGRAAFLETVGALSEDDLTSSCGHDSDWTAKDLIGHVAWAEAGMTAMVRAAAAGTPSISPPDFDIDCFNASRVRRAREEGLPQLLARMEGSRQETLALLDALGDGELDRPAAHPVAGETTVEGIFKIIAYHERLHGEELTKVRERGA